MSEPKVTTERLREMVEPQGALTNEEALALITYCEIGKKPIVPLVNLLARPAEVVERLLAEIALSPTEVGQRFDAAPDDRHSYFLHTFAVYLLALWEERRAYQPLVAYLGKDTHSAIDQLQDTVTEDLHSILGRVYDGSDLGPLKRIIEDDDADSYVRNACLKSLHVMTLLGKLPRDEIVAYYAHVLDQLRGEHNSDWSGCLMLTAAGMQEPTLRSAIDRWFDEGLVESILAGPKDIDRTYRELPDVIDEELLQASRFEALTDYLCDWAWFNSDDSADFDDPYAHHDVAAGVDDAEFDRKVLQPLVRASPKIGRNEPCPCGSGLKYKKCCLE